MVASRADKGLAIGEAPESRSHCVPAYYLLAEVDGRAAD